MKFEIFVEFCPNHEFQVTGYLQKRWMIIYASQQKSFKKLKIPRNIFDANTGNIPQNATSIKQISFEFLLSKPDSEARISQFRKHILSLNLTARKFKGDMGPDLK